MLLLILFLILPSFALAQPEDSPTSIEGAAVETEQTEMVREAAKTLKEDSSAREHLARRILDSSLAAHLTASEDRGRALAEADAWILNHPDEAAQLAVGFGQDDHDGTHAFENSLYTRVSRYFELNPKRYQGILGTLAAAGRESRRVGIAQKLSEEEQREIIKAVFEGKNGEAARIIRGPGSAPQHPEKEARSANSAYATFGGTGIYDRISIRNPSGYSPEVLSYQNALNAEHVPGAPRISETGHLDYATLMHPFYSLSHDVDQLTAQLGQYPSPRSADADGNSMRRVAATGSLARRRDALNRATDALSQLQSIAQESKSVPKITSSLIRSISAKQKEAARWITIASIEGNLQQMIDEEVFWSEMLRSAIRASPAPQPVIEAYLEQGERLKDALTQIENSERSALSCLRSENFASCWPREQQQMDGNASTRRGLIEDIGLFSETPYQLRSAWQPKSSWRQLADRWIRRLCPNSAYVRRLENQDMDFRFFLDTFTKISSGNFPVGQVQGRNLQSRQPG